MGKRNRELNKGRKEALGNALGGWRTIKTVPPGEQVLLFDEEWDATLGSIQIGHKSERGFEVPETDLFQPTHWMPLPEPPTIRD